MEESDALIRSIMFLASTHLIIESDHLEAEARRVESWNAPWARNRRRKAKKLMDTARALCGGRSMPWGVND